MCHSGRAYTSEGAWVQDTSTNIALEVSADISVDICADISASTAADRSADSFADTSADIAAYMIIFIWSPQPPRSTFRWISRFRSSMISKQIRDLPFVGPRGSSCQ